MTRFSQRLAAVSIVALLASPALAAEPASCKKIRISDPGWTDVQVTTSTTAHVLRALGYEPEVTQLSVPITFASLKNKDLDAFLGNWMPSQTETIGEFVKDGSVEVVGENLSGAGFGPVVPDYVAAEGVKTLADLGKFKDKFGGKIYGIEPGAAANNNIRKLMEDKANNLDGFELVESSEAGMLTQAEQMMRNKEWIVFLGWTPHPVMGEMKIEYLGGMENSGFGGATVSTNVRKGYLQECPNVGQFLKNLKFSMSMENAMMGEVLGGKNADDVTLAWLKANPDAATPWISGVTTFDGGDAAAAVKAALAN